MKKILSFALICFVFLFLVGCGLSTLKGTANTDVDFLDVSEVPSVQSEYPNDHYLLITNKRNDCLVFPFDYGIKVYLKVKNVWVEVDNLVEYAGSNNITLSSYSGIEPDGVVFVRPDYSTITGQPDEMRVVFRAYLCNNGSPSDSLSSDVFETQLE